MSDQPIADRELWMAARLLENVRAHEARDPEGARRCRVCTRSMRVVLRLTRYKAV